MTDRSQSRPPSATEPTRRATLTGFGAMAAALLLTERAAAQQPAGTPPTITPPAAAVKPAIRTLTAAPAKVRLRPAPAPETEIWAFDGATPGPVLRAKQGEKTRLLVENKTTAPLSLHWHGLRGQSEMDGVGGFSQPPIAPGTSFEYALTPPDSGSYLYRPLVIGGSSEPAERGLSGFLIVEEENPPPVDLDLPVLIDDWLLGDDQVLKPFDAKAAENAAAGRLGSWLTANGKAPPQRVAVAPGARVRIRLANACNARITRLRFDGMKPIVIAVDSQPTENFEPVRGQLPFPPGTRYDLIFDMPEEDGATAIVTALISSGVPLVRFVAEGPKRTQATPIAMLKPNPALPAAVRLQDARRSEIVIAGGARLLPDTKLDLAGLDLAKPWTLNGGVGEANGKPLFSVKRGTPVVIGIDNKTAFPQPLHVHGHSFRLLHPLDDGWEAYFLDTVQVPEGRKLHIAFIADNPGRWLISSTVLERFDLGLWTWFEVT
ncbi:multicopper oxidase family protein [Bosea caraganae]|uniref:Multicopper oxidase family protein n=1 Tax=Bosea caraganae TaxID=2763117 RepID=A0A370L5D1_9HYPH|nr:multicopper oxidase family protein [Bosea caraganae]RDJ24294.1 multicopper oxidase family protein [Bosea caraganae]RDJ30337.1 multicopper oxidase family protein [Bosea caraganae]